MKDREKLKKLVQIIGDLIKLDGNEWLIEEILKTIGEKSPVEEIAKHPFFEDIYEHCIRLVIDNQAKDFYSTFPINNEELLKNLIYDFKEMEYNRRRDRFYEFSFCLNQQIEGITNYLFDNIYLRKWNELSREKKNKVLESYLDKNGKQITNTLQTIIIAEDKEKKKSWSDQSKFKLVYYLMTRTNDEKLPYDFKRMRDIRNEISIARNESHRGSGKQDWQKEIANAINGNEGKYYFKFYGFLQDYINQIQMSQINTNWHSTKQQSPKKTFKPANTLGDSNPILQELKNKMKSND